MKQRRPYPPASICLAIIRQFLSAHWLWTWFAPLGGVPRAQLDLIARESHVWAERIEELVGRRMWLKDNYFYYAYIVGCWSEGCCPRYLRPEHFATLKANVDRVTVFHGSVAQAAQLRDDFTVASLLDSMDWMGDDMIAEQMAALLPRMDPKGSVFWRCFGPKVHSPVLASLKPALVPDDDGSERVGWYLSQWLAPVPPSKGPKAVDYGQLARDGGGRPAKVNTVLDDLGVMVAMGVHALRSEKDVRAFYRSQGSNYDGFREALLPSRDRLLKFCLPWVSKPKIWLSVGCGTARDIEYVVEHIKACSTRVYLLDLSPDLLVVAAARVEQLGISHLVSTVEADITQAYGDDGQPRGELAGKLPPLGCVDMVTCSYCLTMIPPWKDALSVMVDALAPGGVMAIVDFTVRSDRPSHWVQSFYTWWFANDGVFFDIEHTRALRSHPQLSTFWFSEGEARVPYTPLYPTHYTWAAVKVTASKSHAKSRAK
uniref:Methyltransferase domain-containing protein n=1 Tax=Haptolina ericina TaxID=156174 RepID=A0A7S3BMU1_9EUKA